VWHCASERLCETFRGAAFAMLSDQANPPWGVIVSETPPSGLGRGVYKDSIDYSVFSGEWGDRSHLRAPRLPGGCPLLLVTTRRGSHRHTHLRNRGNAGRREGGASRQLAAMAGVGEARGVARQRPLTIARQTEKIEAFLKEYDPAEADATTVVRNLLQGQYDRPLRVLALNADEGWSRDVSEAIAAKVWDVVEHEGRELTSGTLAFVEAHVGRLVQPTLPLW
jgi:hypothetical protein